MYENHRAADKQISVEARQVRSCHPKVFCKFLRNFPKFTGERVCQSLFSNKVTGLIPVTLLKKRLWYKCFPVNFAKFLRTPFLNPVASEADII